MNGQGAIRAGRVVKIFEINKMGMPFYQAGESTYVIYSLSDKCANYQDCLQIFDVAGVKSFQETLARVDQVNFYFWP